MQRKIIYYLLVLFTIWLIWNDATNSGDLANSFFDWLGDLLTRTLDFLNATLGDGDGEQIP